MTFTPIDYNNENGKVLSDREKLFENEHKSDVRFEVGPEHDSWSVPAHKHILQATCPALEPFLEQNIVRLRHVDKRAFSTFLKFLYTRKVEFSSIQTARETLNICHQFNCTTLAKKAVYYLDLNLNEDNVLEIYKNLQFLCNNLPSAPSLDNNNSMQSISKRQEIEQICNPLLHNCLIIVDANCLTLIDKESFYELCYQDILLILQRDTLKINTELELFNFIEKWSCCECKKQNFVINVQNKRDVLQFLILSIRYGTLLKSEFVNSTVTQSNLLTADQYQTVIKVIEDPQYLHNDNNKHLSEFYALNRPRRYTRLPPYLISERSEAIAKSKKSVGSTNCEPNSKLLDCLRVWSCIFD